MLFKDYHNNENNILAAHVSTTDRLMWDNPES